MKRIPPLLAVAFATTLLVACGGDGSSDVPAPPPPAPPPPVSNEVPGTALASPTAFSQYVGGLNNTDSGDEVDVQKATPPTSESDDPISVT